jgi:hypothetical protein
MSPLTGAEYDKRTHLSPLLSAHWLLQLGSAFGRLLHANGNTILPSGKNSCGVEWRARIPEAAT